MQGRYDSVVDHTDVDTSYRMYCITVGSIPSFSAATLFDASFVNKEIAAWIEDESEATSVSLAGTSHTSAILGSVAFDLNFLNEVTL